MISNLLYKEFRLALHPNLIVFTLMGPLILIPGYPYTMVFLFSLIGNFINLMYTRENNDIYYSALLPLKRSEVVLGKMAGFIDLSAINDCNFYSFCLFTT